MTPLQADHPDHALYQQIREQVTALDARHGRSFDATSERMTVSLLVLAKDNGLDRVDHVVLSNATADKAAGHNVFVVQGELNNPAHQRAYMPTEQAVQTPVHDSLQRFEVISQQQQQIQAQQLEQQLQTEREQQGQVRGMSMS
ncbi:XVIPCD domain-containing protein [uncultured Stenotrophomonas sp.]|uniref:XVIPCD domain-containing protein n=1 Tax=uncultured Stenotrophomonas sp. TaxID=165438 RepID=UPI0031F2FAE6